MRDLAAKDTASSQYPRVCEEALDRSITPTHPRIVAPQQLSAGCEAHFNPKTPVYRRSQYVNEIKRTFTPIEAAHGAIDGRILVHGPDGTGKRTIALQAAEEICSRDGRTLLVVDGRRIETFTPSYLNSYHTLTGSHLPSSDHWHSSLYSLKHYLDCHRTQWLMVITDVDYSFDEAFEDSGRSLAWILPDNGQIIMTSGRFIDMYLDSGLRSAANATRISVSPLRSAELEGYASAICPKLAFLPIYGGPIGLHGRSPLALTVIAANLALLNIDYRTYHKFFNARFSERKAETKKTETWQFSEEEINQEILWEALANRDRWAIRLIVVLTLVDASAVPLELIRNMSVFRRTVSEQLSPALTLLESLSILRTAGGRIWMHPRLHSWYRNYCYKRSDSREWVALRNSLAASLCSSLRSQQRGGYYSCWELAPHIQMLIELLRRREADANCKMLTFLAVATDTAVFRAQFLKSMQSCIFLSYNTIWAPVLRQATTPNSMSEYNIARARIGLSNTIAIADGSLDYQEAAHELRSAKYHLSQLKGQSCYQYIAEKSWMVEVHVMIESGRLADAEAFIDGTFNSTSPISERTKSRLHHIMARCLEEQGVHTAAIQHSHEAMSFWFQYWTNDSRPTKARVALMVIDKHVDILIKLKKYRGALLFIRPLLSRLITNSPQHSHRIWKLAKQGVMCYASLRKLDEAEDLVYQVLNAQRGRGLKDGVAYEISDDIPEEFVLHYFEMLFHIACCYMRHGRLIEGEGLLLYILCVASPRLATQSHVPDVVWQWLLICLRLREDHLSMKQTLAEYRVMYDKEFDCRDVDENVAFTKGATRLYQNSLWAAEDGLLEEWKQSALMTRDSQLQYRLAEDLFGTVEARINNVCVLAGELALSEISANFVSNIDFGNITSAKKSKLLHLVGFDIVGVVFASKLYTTRPSAIMTTSRGEKYQYLLPNAVRTARTTQSQPTDLPGDTDTVPPTPPTIPLLPEDTIPEIERHTEPGDSQGNVDGRLDQSPATRDTATAPLLQVEGDSATRLVTSAAHQNPLEDIPDNHGARQSSEDDAEAFKLHINRLWDSLHSQRTLPEYWSWCYCRRHRSRSGSINPIEIIDKRFLRQIAEEELNSDSPKLVQKLITDCFLVLPLDPRPLSSYCHKKCPCHEANSRGQEDWELQLQRLKFWPTDEPLDYVLASPKTTSSRSAYTGAPPPFRRFVKSRRPSAALTPDETFVRDEPKCQQVVIISPPASPLSAPTEATDDATSITIEEMDTLPRPPAPQPLESPGWGRSMPWARPPRPQTSNTTIPPSDVKWQTPELGSSWTWLQTELDYGMASGENYLIPNSLKIPHIKITLTEDDWGLPGTKLKNRWYWSYESLQAENSDVLEFKILKKKKRYIWEYYASDHRLSAQTLRMQEWDCEWNHPRRCDTIVEEQVEDVSEALLDHAADCPEDGMVENVAIEHT